MAQLASSMTETSSSRSQSREHGQSAKLRYVPAHALLCQMAVSNPGHAVHRCHREASIIASGNDLRDAEQPNVVIQLRKAGVVVMMGRDETTQVERYQHHYRSTISQESAAISCNQPPMMNYSNMIEEKNLKKTFIIATLCSTLIGTFSSSMGLWERVQDKRKQKKKDFAQDDEIKQLKNQMTEAVKGIQNNTAARKQHDDVGDSLERSGAMIRREFDDGYDQFGRRFAIGDTITENRLQAQVIALQQTVINVLQDALMTGRPLTNADMKQLVAASNSARDGSLDALRQQRERQMRAIEGPPQKALPPAKASSRASSSERSYAPPKRASTIVDTDPLFCRYSLDIQYIKKKPLAASFAPGGECRCPDCGLRLDVESDDFWEINKRVPVVVPDGRGYEKEVIEERSFHLGQRFVVKCHTPDGEYACVLCSRHRDADAICPTIETLVHHVGKFHTMAELEKDPDLFLEPPQPQMLALPAPSVPSPPLSVRADRDDRASRVSDMDALDRRIPMPSKYR
ncbi:hypothetical protein Micbo1qcDRAFT_191137 [Microdochium bolleyi]|uniref:Uncharacterized protein n=1 Tax=Microdochium bolleyi TaxID=196109 RepID=A0A136JGQ1_9PEZI|nr:hypothetical protein Micbo1qcDRAFT_191137 [Microdochium bolleyi]